jgi:hypothetical protein
VRAARQTPLPQVFGRLAILVAVVAVGAGGMVATQFGGGDGVPTVSSRVVTNSISYPTTAFTRSSARNAASSRRTAIWCGTPGTADRIPQISAGRSVHFVYAIPSDGPDNLATAWGTSMQNDAETLAGWWQREDPTRAPRLDTFLHPGCGEQLDITLMRLPDTGAALDVIDTRADKILNGLQAIGLTSPYQKIVVYYDGPDTQGRPTICGQGGGYFAITYVNACEGVPNDGINAHELIHAMGAVDDRAPNECPAPNGHHTCDTRDDIMYPFADSSNLFALLLDPGRDDYYAHAGEWFDLQDSMWLRYLDRQVPLTVSVTGSGSVVSDVEGTACAAVCATSWNAGEQVRLTAVPGAEGRFRAWSGGACAGTVDQCTVRLDQATSVTATFGPTTYPIRVRVTGKGRVSSVPGGLRCPGPCAAKLPSFQTVVLVAQAARGWTFGGWSGACRSKLNSCAVQVEAAVATRATFTKIPPKKKPKAA